MIDPLTALGVLDNAASLTGTLSKVFKALYDYGHTVKDAPEKSQQLQEELFMLSNIARRLGITLAKASVREAVKPVPDEAVARFAEMLEEMDGKIAIPKGMSIKRLKWPFSQKENGEYLERIERFKATLSLALNVYQSDATADISESLRKLEITTQTIKATAQQTHKNTVGTWKCRKGLMVEIGVSMMSDKHIKILEWIFPGSVETRHHSIADTRAADSGIWFINHEKVKQWLGNDKAELLVCIGNRNIFPHFLPES
jgi:hypothetical protein